MLRVCCGTDHHRHPGDDRIAGVFVAIDLSSRCIETLEEIDQDILACAQTAHQFAFF
jgi:hypothetical protein